MTIVRLAATVLLAGSLAACAAFPSVGPTADVIDPGAANRDLVDYEVFDVNPTVLSGLQRFRPKGLYARFGSKAPAPPQQIGIGDQLAISIFEAGSSGQLFSGDANAGGANKITTLPPQTVDRDGKVSVPYAGRVQAAGRTPDQVSQAIVAALKSKAVEPQAIVSITQSGAAEATVIGDATGSARVPLNLKGDRLLEVIAQGGGIKTQPQETYIRLVRARESGNVSIRTILADPRENVFVYPGDTVYVTRNTPKFTVLGAVNQQRDYPIDQDRLTLAEALGRANGLNDLQADSSAAFLFRYESPDVVRAINPKSKFLYGMSEIPVVYRLSFRRPSDFFFAQRLYVENSDVIFVANAPTVEINKVVTLARNIAALAAISAGVAKTAGVAGSGNSTPVVIGE